MNVSKEIEIKALNEIRKIVESIGGSESYIGMALDGCFEIAEGNIKNDFACSLKAKLNKIEKELEQAGKEAVALKEELANAKIETEVLRKKLDKELEWKEYENGQNVSQKDYDELVNEAFTKKLSDETAKKLLFDEFGFMPEKVVNAKMDLSH